MVLPNYTFFDRFLVGCSPVTNHLLASRGFTTVQLPASELISITKIAGAQGLARLEDRDVEKAAAG